MYIKRLWFDQNTHTNKAIVDNRPSLAITHMWRHNACFHYNERLTSWRTYFDGIFYPISQWWRRLDSLDKYGLFPTLTQ